MCKECNDKQTDKCFLCKIPFEMEECFKDEKNNSYCKKCIKIYEEEKKRIELEKIQAEIAARPAKPIKNTFHCDKCTKGITTEVIDFEGANLHLECFKCASCDISLQFRKVFQNDKGLACDKCRKPAKCKSKCIFILSERFFRLKSFLKVKAALNARKRFTKNPIIEAITITSTASVAILL